MQVAVKHRRGGGVQWSMDTKQAHAAIAAVYHCIAEMHAHHDTSRSIVTSNLVNATNALIATGAVDLRLARMGSEAVSASERTLAYFKAL